MYIDFFKRLKKKREADTHNGAISKKMKESSDGFEAHRLSYGYRETYKFLLCSKSVLPGSMTIFPDFPSEIFELDAEDIAYLENKYRGRLEDELGVKVSQLEGEYKENIK